MFTYRCSSGRIALTRDVHLNKSHIWLSGSVNMNSAIWFWTARYKFYADWDFWIIFMGPYLKKKKLSFASYSACTSKITRQFYIVGSRKYRGLSWKKYYENLNLVEMSCNLNFFFSATVEKFLWHFS